MIRVIVVAIAQGGALLEPVVNLRRGEPCSARAGLYRKRESKCSLFTMEIAATGNDPTVLQVSEPVPCDKIVHCALKHSEMFESEVSAAS